MRKPNISRCPQNSVDGKHKPQLSTIVVSPIHPDGLVVDIRCRLCGRWGNFKFNLAKIDW